MKKVTKKAVRELISELAEDSRKGRTEWSLIADLFVRFMDEHPKSETTKDFIDWIVYEAQEWLNESWKPFFGVLTKGAMLDFINGWVNEKDIPKFMDFIKEEREDLWEFLTDDEIDEEEYF